jgi:Predicted ATPase (AAA+ superfamily)
MIKRTITPIIEQKIGSTKAIIVIGPRQVGKTTLIWAVLENRDVLFLDGDDPITRRLLTNANTEQLKALIKDKPFVFIDEAQRIENIGLTLKIVTDQIKTTQLFISGSSSFELNNLMREPLTGRKWEYTLYPISWQEFEDYAGVLTAIRQLPLRLVYGMYPEIITHTGNEFELLKQLTDSYLYRDILSYKGIRKPEVMNRLLRALALQVGSEVSYRELSVLLGIDTKTVSAYISLLEQAYVIFKLPSFSRNLRNEIKMNQKIYFYDNGLLNIVKGNLNTWETREDKGVLWENFLIGERIKRNSYMQSLAHSYFWRTKQQQEIDYVEDEKGKITAYELKWSPKAKVKVPELFIKKYQADFHVIHSENFRDFI